MAVVQTKIEKALTGKLKNDLETEIGKIFTNIEDSEMQKFIDVISKAIGKSVAEVITTTLKSDAMVIGACPPTGGALTGGKIV